MQHLINRLFKTAHGLEGQPVKKIDVHLVDTGLGQQVDCGARGFKALLAPDSLLHARIEVLHAKAGAVHAVAGQNVDAGLVHLGRVNLDRELIQIVKAERPVQGI